MTDDPFLQLVCDALELMSRPFASRRSELSFALEFYHQFRKLWDRGIPVGMGLGHLLLRSAVPGDFADPAPLALLVDRLGENGRSDERLAVIEFCAVPFEAGGRLAAVAGRAAEATINRAVLVAVGTAEEFSDSTADSALPETVVIRFDPARWTARVV